MCYNTKVKYLQSCFIIFEALSRFLQFMFQDTNCKIKNNLKASCLIENYCYSCYSNIVYVRGFTYHLNIRFPPSTLPLLVIYISIFKNFAFHLSLQYRSFGV